MKKQLLALKSCISPSDRQKSETRQVRSSPALDNARTFCQLLSNLGSGGINVPGLQAAGLVAVQIIDIIKKTKGNKRDGEELVSRIVELLDPIGKALENHKAMDIDLRLKEDLEHFTRDLEKIREILQPQVDRNLTARVLNSVGDGEDILRCKELVVQAINRFQVYTFIALRLKAVDHRHDHDESRLHNTHSNKGPSQEHTYYSIMKDANAVKYDNSLQNRFPSSQPLAPEIFFGRDKIVSDLTSLIVRDEQTRLAILGTGGMGKTSTALHILHHQEIVARYNNHRYFVGCDAVTSAESLAALILQIIQAPLVTGENILTVLHQALLSAPPTLLLLDNFETVWAVDSGRDGVLDLLQKIGNSKRVSLIITMRSAVPPPGIVWTSSEILPPLEPPDAKSLFLAINPSLSARDVIDDEYLDILLAEMGYVALAVQLLAQVSIGFSPLYMLKRWREKKTAILCTHKVDPGKLESIDVSIELSLATLEITSNPDAVQLLAILCQLPDGLHQWEERLPYIWVGEQSAHDLIHVLHKTALLIIAGSRLKVLSPIRHFINNHHQVDVDHIKSLENEFWALVNKYAATPHGPGFLHARDIIEPEMGNIHSLIKHAVETHPSADLVEIVLKVLQFLRNTVPSTELLNCIMEMVKKIGSPIQQACALQLEGEILHIQAKYTKASETLTEAQKQFLKIGDILGATRCSRSLGDSLRLLNKYTEATETLAEAQRQFLNNGDVLGTAQCSQSLGEILRMQSKYIEASETLTEAQGQFLKVGDVLGQAQCSKSLGNILRMQHKYVEASETLAEAQRQFLNIGDVLGQVHCSRSLGDILRMQSKYNEASQTLRKAQKQYFKIGNVLGQAQCLRSLGDILRMQNKYTEASGTLMEAQRHFLEISNVLGAAQCSQSLGDILYMQDKYTEALETLTEARRQFTKIGYVLGAAQCSQRLGEVLHMQKQYTEASETLRKAQGQFLEIGDVLGVAQCLQSLGDIFRMQSQYTKASETLAEAQRQFLEIGDVLGAAQCLQSLGDILHMQSQYTKALEILTEAQGQFLEIGDDLGMTQCSQSLDKILHIQSKYTEASEALTDAQI